jgi:hypothetical protein
MTFAASALALTGTSIGKCRYIAADLSIGSSVTVVGAGGSMGLCTGSVPGPTNDRVFRIPDNANGDKMRNLILAAQLANRTLQVSWNDASRDTNNRCYANAVSF